MKRPAFQFYPSDWRTDSALQNCSIAARGLWIEMMCIMHGCKPYGYLTINNKAMSTAQLARLVGESEKSIKALLAELENAGIFSRTEAGWIYSRRMVGDEQLRSIKVEGGKKGQEYGQLGAEYGSKGGRPKKDKGGFEAQKKTPLADEKKPPPSSSTSTSSSIYSVSNETDARASPHSVDAMTKDELWTAGKSLLNQAGMPQAQCGSFVGKLCKDYGEQVTLDAVRTAVVERPADPPAFLKAVCQRLAGQRCNGKRWQSFDTINYRAGIAADGSF